jgi:hypothetical protein
LYLTVNVAFITLICTYKFNSFQPSSPFAVYWLAACPIHSSTDSSAYSQLTKCVAYDQTMPLQEVFFKRRTDDCIAHINRDYLRIFFKLDPRHTSKLFKQIFYTLKCAYICLDSLCQILKFTQITLHCNLRINCKYKSSGLSGLPVFFALPSAHSPKSINISERRMASVILLCPSPISGLTLHIVQHLEIRFLLRRKHTNTDLRKMYIVPNAIRFE